MLEIKDHTGNKFLNGHIFDCYCDKREVVITKVEIIPKPRQLGSSRRKGMGASVSDLRRQYETQIQNSPQEGNVKEISP